MARKKNSQSAKKPAVPEPQLSPHSTEAAFLALKPALDALPQSALRQPNFNLQQGALVALAAHGLLDKPEKQAILEALGKAGVVNVELVANLAMVARAAWFVRHKLDLAEAVHSDAALPAQLVTDALETRKRMLKVLEYHLDADAQAQGLLAGIRAGSGHVDLANDLIALADMYEDHENEIRSDKKNYRVADTANARKLADDIIGTLGGSTTPQTQEWRNYQARVFTLLEKHHEEAIRVGRFLYWYEGGDELFPTMFSAVRSRPAKKEVEGEEVATPQVPGGEATP
ncbi:MAG: hypothetical protein IPM54_11170 [Polyangiaceae bacterium]|nr:hypothetical protein [Polyangiaceae bacterium]